MAVVLVTTPILAKTLETETFGLFVTISAITSYLAMSDLGIGATLLTVLSSAWGRKDHREMAAIVFTSARILLVAAFCVAVLGIILSYAVDIPSLLGARESDRREALIAFRVFFLGFSVGIPLSLAGRIQSALQQGAEASRWLGLGTTTSACAAATASLTSGSLVITIAASVIALDAVLLLQAVRVLRQHRWILSRETSTAGYNRRLISTSFWLFLLQILAVIAFQSDILVISSTLGADDAAIFHGSLRAFSLVSLITTALAAQFWPAAAEALSSGDRAWVKVVHRRLIWLLPGLSLTAGLFMIAFGRTLIGWWLGAALVPPISLLVSFTIWTTYSAFVLPYSQLLNAAGILKWQVALGIPMTVLNLVASICLSRHIGVAGPLIGSLLAHILVVLVPTMVLVRRVLHSSGPH